MNIFRLAAIGVLTTVSLAVADDTAVTLGAGGLVPVKSSDITMESEDLQVSVHQITVKYLFRNTSSRDLDVMVAFPLPELDGGALANVMINTPFRDAVNFMDFRLYVAGKKVTPKVEIRAFFDGVEITSELRALGLPLSVLDGDFAVAMKKLAAADLSRLKKGFWVECTLGTCLPYWQSRVQFYWTQRFAAGATVGVEHVYRPVVGGSGSVGVYRNDDGVTSVKPYCGSPDVLEQIKRQKQLVAPSDENRPVLLERRVQFILTTANNWKGPIHRFHLSVVSDNPEDTVVTCMPGLQRVAPTRYELDRSDFHPDRELEALVLQVAK